MNVNQKGDPVYELSMDCRWDFKDQDEVATAVLLLAERMGVKFVRTNATKNGCEAVELRPAS